jgi:hypothetical protein
MQQPIRFKFAPAKARAAVHWMLTQRQTCDLHTVLKACYFADKKHLNEHDRPVFGATYRAMKYGPVPVEIYDMAKGDPYYLAELSGAYPWMLNGYHLKLVGNEKPNMRVLSKTDIEAIKFGFDLSKKLTFNQRTAATHGRDWQRANLGIMNYEDMLEDWPNKEAKLTELRETARFMRL